MTQTGSGRRMAAPALLAVVALLAVGVTRAALAAPIPVDPILDRYAGRSIVTGTDLRDRPKGFAASYVDVLVKVSGDPTLARDARVADMAREAAARVQRFDYWDRKAGIQLSDEQGSSDRSYFITVHFDPAKIDADLASLGRTPWTAERPAVVPVVHVRSFSAEYDVTAEEPRAAEMRAAFAESGQKFGLPVLIPTTNATAPGALNVRGTLAYSQQALGWVATWHLDWQGRGYDWGIVGVSYDDAFRNLVGGAARVAAGLGGPEG